MNMNYKSDILRELLPYYHHSILCIIIYFCKFVALLFAFLRIHMAFPFLCIPNPIGILINSSHFVFVFMLITRRKEKCTLKDFTRKFNYAFYTSLYASKKKLLFFTKWVCCFHIFFSCIESAKTPVKLI